KVLQGRENLLGVIRARTETSDALNARSVEEHLLELALFGHLGGVDEAPDVEARRIGGEGCAGVPSRGPQADRAPLLPPPRDLAGHEAVLVGAARIRGLQLEEELRQPELARQVTARDQGRVPFAER